MPTTYARVFVEILDSSIADDFEVRHVFEDFLKLAGPGGEVDITRNALCRRLNVPREVLDRAIGILEAPDTKSRDTASEGRRLLRLDDHRDWGWRITNWSKYERIQSRVDSAARRMRSYYRQQDAAVAPDGAATPPSPVPPPVCNPIPNPCSLLQCNIDPLQCNIDPLHSPETELPNGFPETKEAAVTGAPQVPAEFAGVTWEQAMGRNGRDAKGQPIFRWAHYVAAMWKFDQSRRAERKAIHGNGRANPHTAAGRNAGTYNEGRGSAYADAVKRLNEGSGG